MLPLFHFKFPLSDLPLTGNKTVSSSLTSYLSSLLMQDVYYFAFIVSLRTPLIFCCWILFLCYCCPVTGLIPLQLWRFFFELTFRRLISWLQTTFTNFRLNILFSDSLKYLLFLFYMSFKIVTSLFSSSFIFTYSLSLSGFGWSLLYIVKISVAFWSTVSLF